MTQVEILLDYLEKYGSITGLECITELGIMNYIRSFQKVGV